MNKFFVRFPGIFLSAFAISGFVPHFEYSPNSHAESNNIVSDFNPTSDYNYLAVPGENEIPALVYRADMRDPVKIFRTGFQLPGAGINNNLLDQVRGTSAYKVFSGGSPEQKKYLRGTTNFISTSASFESSMFFLPNLYERKTLEEKAKSEGFVYIIQPDDKFFSANKSLIHAEETIAKKNRKKP